MQITDTSLSVFLTAARDAGNWSGEPMFQGTMGDRGNLTQLKLAKLVTTFTDRDNTFIRFTDAGVSLAAQHGIAIRT